MNLNTLLSLQALCVNGDVENLNEFRSYKTRQDKTLKSLFIG